MLECLPEAERRCFFLDLKALSRLWKRITGEWFDQNPKDQETARTYVDDLKLSTPATLLALIETMLEERKKA